MPAIWELVDINESGVMTMLSPQQQQDAAAGRPAKQNNLAILIPHTGEVTCEWALNFKNLRMPEGTQVFFSRGMPIDVTRDQLTEDVFKRGFEWLFFLDSDVILPQTAVVDLLSHNKPLISGVYDAKKKEGFFPAVWRGVDVDGEGKFAPITQFGGRIIEADVTGAGCLLVNRRILEGIRAKTDLPFFYWTKDRAKRVVDAFEYPDKRMAFVSEDFYFCLLAKACTGEPLLVDTEIRCGHIATMKIQNGGVTIPAV